MAETCFQARFFFTFWKLTLKAIIINNMYDISLQWVQLLYFRGAYFWSQSPIRLLLIADWIYCWAAQNIIVIIVDLCFVFSWLRKGCRVVSSGIAASPSVIICLEFQPFSRWTLVLNSYVSLIHRVCCSIKDFHRLHNSRGRESYNLLSHFWNRKKYK